MRAIIIAAAMMAATSANALPASWWSILHQATPATSVQFNPACPNPHYDCQNVCSYNPLPTNCHQVCQYRCI
jgi:hypothetical protein